ncbi:adhesion G protein-coupled receptor E5-like isoform X2 [Dendropsophus ebraccatus]|uniref:adhesion G protein-coupled receptor E5-like isoform X2 n=1 Tax=Dendropsophus ebraccatus TaxID=150705 RepID=UPI003831AE5A
MPRFWNTGIGLMVLLLNGLTSMAGVRPLEGHSSSRPPSTTGASKSTTNQELWCPNGTLPPGTQRCRNHICSEDGTVNRSYPCIPGYRKDGDDCLDISECRDRTHVCGSSTTCQNTPGSYYCKCDGGFLKDNQTSFCPSNNKTENTCTDIDECSKSWGICGSNTVCKNFPGSYKCLCASGYLNVSNTCSVKCKYISRKEICEQDQFECNLKKLTDNFTPYCENVTSQEKLSVEKLIDGLDDLIDGLSNLNKTERLQKAGSLLKTVEETVQNLALVEQKSVSHVNAKKTISFQVSHGPSNSGTLSVQGSKSSITLDSKTAAGNTNVAILGCLEYTNITHILKEADFLEEISNSKSFQLVSPVVSVFLGISNTSSLQQPVSMTLNFTKTVSRKMSCVSWSVPNSIWTSRGCVMVHSDEHGVTCNCTHLTSFAVLMLLHDAEIVEQSWTLDLITQIGLSISIFCLVLAIITFCFCRSLHGKRNTIHMHLCISLFLGNCIFLLGISATHNQVLCGIVAGLLHALYLCAFCWMSLEGLELYLMLVKVFNTHLKKRYLLAVGYGIPAVIVTISAAIFHKGYGTDKYCWLSLEKGFVWAFLGPVCVIILINCGIFVLTVWKLADKMSSVSPDHGNLKRIRTLTVTSLAQLCILGSCWAFGFFMFGSATLFFAYAFTILNALQGLQIFCLHCLMHQKVRKEYKMWLCALAHFKAPIYSEFSDTSNSHTTSKSKTGKESGL